MMPNVIYLCNGDREGCSKTHCSYLYSDGFCRHTSDERYAKNSPEKRHFIAVDNFRVEVENDSVQDSCQE